MAKRRLRPAEKRPGIVYSTWPFRDGYPWDEELIRSGHRALSTHGLLPSQRMTVWPFWDLANLPP